MKQLLKVIFAGTIFVTSLSDVRADETKSFLLYEGVCVAIYQILLGENQGKFSYSVLEDFHVLEASQQGTFEIASPDVEKIVSLMCQRSRPVPSPWDNNVILSGYDLLISNMSNSDRVYLGRLSRPNEFYNYELGKGSLTDKEQAEVTDILAYYLREENRSVAEASNTWPPLVRTMSTGIGPHVTGQFSSLTELQAVLISTGEFAAASSE